MATEQDNARRLLRLKHIKNVQYTLETGRLKGLRNEHDNVRDRQRALLLQMTEYDTNPLSGSAQVSRTISFLARQQELLERALDIQEEAVLGSHVALEIFKRRSAEASARAQQAKREQEIENTLDFMLSVTSLPKG